MVGLVRLVPAIPAPGLSVVRAEKFMARGPMLLAARKSCLRASNLTVRATVSPGAWMPFARPGMIERLCVAGLVALLFVAAAASASPRHPLDPLGAGELAQTRSILMKSGQFSKNTDFSWVELDEPAKKIVTELKPGDDMPRRAYVAAVDFDRKKSFDVIVDLKEQRIASLTDIGDREPGITDHDGEVARAIIDADEAVRGALVRRGLKIPGKVSDSVTTQLAAIGRDPGFAPGGNRLIRVLFASDQDSINEFSPFLDGMMAVVDLFAGRVIRLIDDARVPSRKVPHDIFRMSRHGAQPAAKSKAATRRETGSLMVERNTVAWRQWHLRFGFNLREGLVLYQVAFDDAGRSRSILYRAAVADVITAYGDPGASWSWMELLDEGAFGLGASSIDVRPGREVPADALTLSPVMPDPANARFSSVSRNRIYVYERAAGNLMHYRQDELTYHAGATELVIGFMSSLGNYVYGFNWVFRQDGSFGFEAELAGEILTKFVRADDCEVCKAVAQGPGPGGEPRTYEAGGDDAFGTFVHPGLVGLNHQHWFNLRLDFDIDGTRNAVMETNVKHVEGRAAQADAVDADRFFSATQTVFGRAEDAKRNLSEETSRQWTIYNPSTLGRGGRPSGYAVVPGANGSTVFGGTREQGLAGYTFHHFWVTPYRDGQLYPVGAHPNRAGNDYIDTLFHYANDELIYDKDIVVWYSLGETHIPRPEDYPVMTNMKLSVDFRPNGFFERNPVVGRGKVYDR
jgi:primary-amine oxidase